MKKIELLNKIAKTQDGRLTSPESGNDNEYYFYYKDGERKCWKCREKEQTVL